MLTNDLSLYIAFYVDDRVRVINWINNFKSLTPYKNTRIINETPLKRIKIILDKRWRSLEETI